MPLVLIPIYHHSGPEMWGFAFAPERPGAVPAAWAWVEAGHIIEAEPGSPRQVVREPGRLSPRYAHELVFESERQEELPLFQAGPLEP